MEPSIRRQQGPGGSPGRGRAEQSSAEVPLHPNGAAASSLQGRGPEHGQLSQLCMGCELPTAPSSRASGPVQDAALPSHTKANPSSCTQQNLEQNFCQATALSPFPHLQTRLLLPAVDFISVCFHNYLPLPATPPAAGSH